MRTVYQIFLGYVLSGLAICLATFYLIAWRLFDGSDWVALFTSPFGLVFAFSCGTAVISFWVWMLVSYIQHRDEDGIIWGVVLLLGAQIGAAIYFVSIYRKRKKISA